MAGTGSTAAGLTKILYDLALHPEWQARVFDEIKTHTVQGSNIVLSYNVANKLPALQAVMKESFRIAPPVAMGGPRYITPGAEEAIPGLKAPLPVGTMVASNIYVICHDKKTWGENADEWKPERWLQGNDKPELNYAWPVFGKGTRTCVGKELVWIILKKSISAVSDSSCFRGHTTDCGHRYLTSTNCRPFREA